MELRQVVTLVVLGGLGVVIYLGFWVLSLRLQKPGLRTIGLKICLLIGAMMVMVGAIAVMRNAGPPDFVTMTPGPVQGASTSTSEVQFPVTDVDAMQVVELTPMALQSAMGYVKLVYRVEDPSGKVLSQGMQVAGEDEGRNYQTLRFSFHASGTGAHKLFVEMPQGVDQTRVVVKEVQ
jgi:hypothetical protein